MKLKLSPDEFAEQLCFTGAHAGITVWRWENGNRKPSAQSIALMKQLVPTGH